MAKAKAKAAPKSTQNQTKGGARPGAGRKPKAVTALKAALIAAPLPADGPIPPPATPEAKATAAAYAWDLFVRAMQDATNDTDTRLDCAREVLNRAWGKPYQAVEVTGKDQGPLQIRVVYADGPAEPADRLPAPAPPGSGEDPA